MNILAITSIGGLYLLILFGLCFSVVVGSMTSIGMPITESVT